MGTILGIVLTIVVFFSENLFWMNIKIKNWIKEILSNETALKSLLSIYIILVSLKETQRR